MLKTKDDGEEGDWVGRSVTLILRPGICNRLQVQAPYLEWVTMGGGLNNVVEATFAGNHQHSAGWGNDSPVRPLPRAGE